MMKLSNVNDKYNSWVDCLATVFKRRYITVATIVIYKCILDYIYCTYIGGGATYFYVNVSVLNIINGWIITILTSLFINYLYKDESASSIMLAILNMIYFIPITTYCGYGGGSSSFFFFSMLYWTILLLLQIKVPRITMQLSHPKVDQKIFLILTVLFSLISVYIWAKYTNFRVMYNLLDVYDVRAEAATYNIPTVLAYIRQFSSIVVPMLILLSLIKHKYTVMIWLLFITWINFSYAGNKAVILFPILLIGGYLFYRKGMISFIFPIGIVLELIAIIESELIGSNMIVSLFFRRTGLVLAQLSEYFYRFFSENPTDLFRDSIMSKFGFDSLYGQKIANVIGNNFETQVINCNNGLLADVWSGLGLIGIIVMPMIIIICLRLFDFVSCGIDSRVIISLAAYYAIVFANSTWSTVLVTHGFVIMCMLLMIFPRPKAYKGAKL